MAMKKIAPLWTIIILALFQIVGVFALTPVLANIIYLLAIFAAIVTVIHLARLI